MGIPPLLALRVSTTSIIFNVFYGLKLVCAEHVGGLTVSVGGQIMARCTALTGGWFFFTAVPGRPTGVTLLEAVKDYMVLGWLAPASDGGADVRGYFVDYRTVKGDLVGKWHEMNHQALTTTSYKVRFGLDYRWLTVRFLNASTSVFPGRKPEGEPLLRVPGARDEHGRPE